MTLHHDAYLFDPEAFTSAMQPHRKLLDNLHTIEAKMKSNVVSLLANDRQVQDLADNYGSWATQDIYEVNILDHQEISFLLTFTLYKTLKTEDKGLGLRSHWQGFLDSLVAVGWDNEEAQRLVLGRNFCNFPEQYWGESIIPKYWELNTFSTGGNIGWLNLSDVSFFHDKLLRDAPYLQNIEETQLHIGFHLANTMLENAFQNESGLCLVISG